METRTRKKYNDEYKEEVAKLIVDGKYTMNQAAAKLDVDHRKKKECFICQEL